MAKEYIEREAAKRELLSWAVCMNHPEYLMRDDTLHVIDSIPAADVVEVVRCKDCVHAVEIEKDYIRKLFIDGTKQCELGRGDQCFGYSIISNDGFCDSGERKDGDGND